MTTALTRSPVADVLAPRTFNELVSFVDRISGTPFVPSHFRGHPNEVLAARGCAMSVDLLSVEEKDATLLDVRLKDIRVENVSDAEAAEKAASLDRFGLQQPVLLVFAEAMGEPPYVIADGRRRVAGARELGWTTIRALVRDRESTTPAEQSALTLELNTSRRDNPLAERDAIRTLLDAGMDEKGIAKRLNRDVSWVTKRLALDGLAPRLEEALRAGTMTFTTALRAAKLDMPQQATLVARVTEKAKDAGAPLAVSAADVEAMFEKRVIAPTALFDVDVHGAPAPAPSSPPVASPAVAVSDDVKRFIRQTASLVKDGECTEHGGEECPDGCDFDLFDMPNDDAIETLHNLIEDARHLMASSAAVREVAKVAPAAPPTYTSLLYELTVRRDDPGATSDERLWIGRALNCLETAARIAGGEGDRG